LTKVARIPADVSKRLALFSCALALAAAACSQPPVGTIQFGSGTQFIPQVADSIDNVGMGSAITLNADGIPFVSYWGFPAVLKEGDIAVTRPIGVPFVPGVLLASQDKGVWNHGAAAMYQDAPSRVVVPFGPVTEKSLSEAEPTNTNGTDVAVDANGGIHVVWAAQDGIWYGSGGSDAGFTVEQVIPRDPVRVAGPLGWPSIAVDDAGVPWIAVTVAGPAGPQVLAATPKGNGWDIQTVAEPKPCSGCPQGLRTEIAATSGGPVVVYEDGDANAVMAARPDGRGWTSQTVESGADGVGISVAVGNKGAIAAAYYASSTSVHVATSTDGTTWTAAEAETVGAPTTEGDITGQSTGIALTDDGTSYLTWFDPGTKGVDLASSAGGGAFDPIETRDTHGGEWPAVAVAPDGSTVFMSWYDPVEQNLAYGTYGETGGLVVAAPSPSLVLSSEAPAAGGCSANSSTPETKITVTAPVGAASSGFDTTCLVAAAGTKLAITFDNQDPGQLHNFSVYKDSSAAPPPLFSSGTPALGPETQPGTSDPLDPGTYFFRCDVHTTTMTGTFIVAPATKK
jgi:hypothetical protein